MSLVVLGLSHQTAPVELREQVAFTAPGRLHAALHFLKEQLAPAECLLLSTCNRTELYVAGSDQSGDGLRALLKMANGNAESVPASVFFERRGHAAVEHLFRVAAGLDSMILGESDIVRQIKEAYTAATSAGTSGPTLNPLFHEALRVAKRARTELDLTRGAFSVGHAAADMAISIFGDLMGRSVLVLGAGQMSETTARHLSAAGATSIIVANRTYDRAAALAEVLGGRAIHFDRFPEQLEKTDIVIASTAAPTPIVHRPMVEAVMRRRRRRELFLIDIALPRDISSEVGEIEDVYLYDLDDLQRLVDSESAERRKRAEKAESLVVGEARAYAARLRASQTATPLLSSVRAKHQAIADEELARLQRRLPHLSEADRAVIARTLEAVVQKIAHDPTLKIKEFAASDDTEKLATVRQLYGLDDTP